MDGHTGPTCTAIDFQRHRQASHIAATNAHQTIPIRIAIDFKWGRDASNKRVRHI